MPLLSMTGFGRGESLATGGRRVVAELRSVNHRFLELKLRLGREDAELEAELGKLVRSRLERGAVSLSLREEGDEGATDGTFVDMDRAAAWLKTLSTLAHKLDTTDRPTLAMITGLPGVLRARATETPRAAFAEAARHATKLAVDAMVDVRRREGDALAVDLAERLSVLDRLRIEVAERAASEPARHHARLQERVAALLAVPSVELARELAMLAERLDVSEELVRLGAHLEEAGRLLKSTGPTGRRLDFLAQEIHREVNTIGSKAQAAELTTRVVDMKVELERFREQVQNVE